MRKHGEDKEAINSSLAPRPGARRGYSSLNNDGRRHSDPGPNASGVVVSSAFFQLGQPASAPGRALIVDGGEPEHRAANENKAEEEGCCNCEEEEVNSGCDCFQNCLEALTSR